MTDNMELSVSTNCQHCEKSIEGRSNKKFCSIKCKNAFHNAKNYKKDIVHKINNILLKNYKSIQKVYDTYGEKYVPKEVLSILGYDSTYYTHKSITGEKIIYIYDFGVKEIIDGHIQIVKNEELTAQAAV